MVGLNLNNKMKCFMLTEKDYKLLFDEKIKELEQSLPNMKVGVNCAEIILTNILCLSCLTFCR